MEDMGRGGSEQPLTGIDDYRGSVAGVLQHVLSLSRGGLSPLEDGLRNIPRMHVLSCGDQGTPVDKCS